MTLGSAASSDVGGAGHTFTVDDTTGTGPLNLDASGMSANLLLELTSANFNASDAVTGGTGSDTIQLVDTTGVFVTDAAFTHVTGIETLKIGGSADNTVTLGANASNDVGGLGHLFTLDDSAGLGNLFLNASAMTADLKVLTGSGTDFVTGGSGNDTFFASIGNDIFSGGTGANTYVFNSREPRQRSDHRFQDRHRPDSGFGRWVRWRADPERGRHRDLPDREQCELQRCRRRPGPVPVRHGK